MVVLRVMGLLQSAESSLSTKCVPGGLKQSVRERCGKIWGGSDIWLGADNKRRGEKI